MNKIVDVNHSKTKYYCCKKSLVLRYITVWREKNSKDFSNRIYGVMLNYNIKLKKCPDGIT